MMATNRPLVLHQEPFRSSIRCQVGHFAQVLPMEEARLLARIGATLGVIESEMSVWATIGVQCAISEAPRLLHVAKSKPEIKWLARDSRQWISRSLGFGSISVTGTAHSLEGVAEGMSQAWPTGRVIVGLGSAQIEDIDTSWLEETVEPPEALLTDFSCILVSFFHGDHVDIYGKEISEAAIESVTRFLRASGREVAVSADPL